MPQPAERRLIGKSHSSTREKSTLYQCSSAKRMIGAIIGNFGATKSFGTISVAYANLAPAEFSVVCKSFGLPHDVLKSWLHSLNYIRNICAPHGRLWNRE